MHAIRAFSMHAWNTNTFLRDLASHNQFPLEWLLVGKSSGSHDFCVCVVCVCGVVYSFHIIGVTMVRTKIEINVSALGQRTKSMNMIIGSNTTCEDVLRKILEKFHLRESPTKYQLLAVAKNDAGSQGGMGRGFAVILHRAGGKVLWGPQDWWINLFVTVTWFISV